MNKDKWNAMTKKERLALIFKDKSMRHPHWKVLADTWASKDWDDLNALQKPATEELFQL